MSKKRDTAGDWGDITHNLGNWGPDVNEHKWDGDTHADGEVLQRVPIAEQAHRRLPNSDPARDGSMSYQRQPWQDKGDNNDESQGNP